MKILPKLAALALIVLAATGAQKPVPAPSRAVLFVGNSLTSVNDLPHLVERVAAAAGRPLRTQSVAFNDFSLEDHWQQGDAERAIRSGQWAAVVLQQGPSALPESRELLLEWTARFDAVIRRGSARTALYMVWPAESRFQDFDRVSESYAQAATSVGGLLLPVGDAWRAVWREKPGYPLYGPDRFHPSPAASLLAAIVMVDYLTGAVPAPGALKTEAGRAGIALDDVEMLIRSSAATHRSSR